MSQWNESQPGGFAASQSPMVGKTPQTGARNPMEQNMLPVTIKLINNAEVSEDGSSKRIHGRPLTTISVCGRVTQVDAKATYTCYTIDDSTGMMEVRQWSDNESEGQENATNIKENDYVNVYGKISLYNGQCQINCYNIIKCTTYNKVIHHAISVMYANEMLKKIKANPPQSNIALGMQAMTSAGTDAGDAENLQEEEMASWTPMQRKIYQAIKDRQGSHDNGVHTPDLVGQLGVNGADLRDALTFLTNEGMIYDTTSEDWVRTTDAM